MDKNKLECCEPVKTISDNEREITDVLDECIGLMYDFSDFINNSASGELKSRDGIECYSDNVAHNLILANTLRTQILDLKRAF